MKTLICLTLLLACLSAAHAAEFCATTSGELQAALTAAESNGQDDEVRIQTGTYNAPAGGFVFNNRNGTPEDKDITLSGGWTPFFGNACGQQVAPSALETKLNGNGMSRVLRMEPSQGTSITVELITFLAGNTEAEPQSAAAGAGLWVDAYNDYIGDLLIERNVFMSNASGSFGGGLAGAGGVAMVIRNNLFLANQASCANGAASLAFNGARAAVLINNTVAFNSIGDDCLGNPAFTAGGLRLGGNSPGYMANNIFWGNENVDLRLDTDTVLVSNDYQFLDGTPAPGSGINYQLDPKFRLTNFTDMHLANDSPLVDLGVVPPAEAGWALSPLDLDGMTRVVGSSVDLGAYENVDAIFVNGFETP